MSYTYNYQRNKTGGCYDLENIITMNGEVVESISPATEIEVALSGKHFKLFGNDEVLDCTFEEELNASEQTILDGIIANSRQP